MKGVSKSQTKYKKFEDYKKKFGWKKYQREFNNYILRSIDHEMYLQEVKKSTLSIFDDKRKFLSKLKSLPWN